jgi:uncharacterized protein (DUF849 family)
MLIDPLRRWAAYGERTVGLIRDTCPILIQISTGVGLGVPFEDRARLVELRPQMATLNPCSMSFGAGEFRTPQPMYAGSRHGCRSWASNRRWRSTASATSTPVCG